MPVQAVIPSGSTNGRLILATATSTPGVLIHTATAAAGQMDEVNLWAVNDSATGASVKVTIEWGSAAAADNIILQVPANSGLYPICSGRLNGGVTAKVFASTASVVSILAVVNRITP
jgi:hypothetical protein